MIFIKSNTLITIVLHVQKSAAFYETNRSYRLHAALPPRLTPAGTGSHAAPPPQ